MSDYVLFQMYSGVRSQLIEKHKFYVQQAQKRLLEQFTDEAISQEADQVAEETWKKYGENFNPDIDDESHGAEAAYDEGVWRYQLLTELRDNVRLSIIAGFFHEWEKNLRQWLVNEVNEWLHGNVTKDKIWKAQLTDLFDLLKSFGWSLQSSTFFPHLDACRLVVNVYKHGDGQSLENLSSNYPEFLKHPFESMRGEMSKMWLSPSHEHLTVTDSDLDVFSNAIVQFWTEIPENVCNNQITDPPNWLINAIKKDRDG